MVQHLVLAQAVPYVHDVTRRHILLSSVDELLCQVIVFTENDALSVCWRARFSNFPVLETAIQSTTIQPKTVRAVGYARSATSNAAYIMRQIASIRGFCTEMNYRLLAEYSDNATGGQEHSKH